MSKSILRPEQGPDSRVDLDKRFWTGVSGERTAVLPEVALTAQLLKNLYYAQNAFNKGSLMAAGLE